VWLSYALVCILTRGEAVVYHSGGDTFLFWGDSVYSRIRGVTTEFPPPTKRRTWCLIDPDIEINERDISFMTLNRTMFPVLASSPNPLRYKIFRKQRKSVPMKFMPLWTRNELKKG
jgi:hypothetical protein